MSTVSLPLGRLPDVFDRAERLGLQYCLLRGGESAVATTADVDVLVRPADLDAFIALAEELEFVRLPAWGHWPHHFLLTYDETVARWIKLDVVTAIAFGQPIKTLGTNLAERCLERRYRGQFAFLPAPEDEFLILLLHCLLDKAAFPQPHRTRLLDLCRRINDRGHARTPSFIAQLALLFPARLTWDRLAMMLRLGQWGDLLMLRAALIMRLDRGQELRRRVRAMGGNALRKLDHWRFRPGLTLALLAPDGAGKTMLAARIADSCPLPVRRVYMGSNRASSTVDLAPSRWLRGLADLPRLRSLPIALGLRLSADLLELWYRYAVGAYLGSHGHLVVFDRYSYDALIGPPPPTLRGRVRRWLTASTCPAPDLVVYLDAPAAELRRRKPEHDLEWLERQRQGYRQLAASLPGLVVLDAGNAPADVQRQLVGLIWRRLHDRFARQPRAGIAAGGPPEAAASPGGGR